MGRDQKKICDGSAMDESEHKSKSPSKSESGNSSKKIHRFRFRGAHFVITSRQFYTPVSSGKWKRLSENMSGFLATSNMKEKNAMREAINILEEYHSDDLESLTCTNSTVSSSQETPMEDSETVSANKSEDIGDELQKELSSLRTGVRRTFRNVDTGVHNLIFIEAQINDPVSLVTKIFEDLQLKNELKSRYLLRLIPVQVTCHTSRIKEVCRVLFKKYFLTDYTTFQIAFKARFNSSLTRDDVIKKLADIVVQTNPLNVVDLTNPKLTVIVEVVKNIACIAVVKDFNKFKRFNLHEIVRKDNTAQQQDILNKDITKGNQQKLSQA